MNIKNKTTQSLILAIANALIIGLPGLVGAHEAMPEQDAAVQRPVPSDRATGNTDGSTSREDAVRRRSSVPGSDASRNSGMIDRSSQGIGIDRDGRSVDRPSQDWGVNRADDHGGGH